MILVTGGTGLVGSFIVRELLSRGEHVRVLARAASNKELLSEIANQIDWVEGDILEVETLKSALEGVSHVVHAAALVSFSSSDTDRLLKINVEGTQNLINVCLYQPIQKFIHISSISALGDISDEQEFDENTKWNPGGEQSGYGVSKHFAELEVWRAIEEGLSAVIVSPSVVLGPSSYTKSSAKIYQNAKKHGYLTVDGSLDIVDVRDVARASVALLFSDLVNERYILSASQVTLRKLISQIRIYFSLPAPKFHLSIKWLKRGAYVERVVSKILFKTPKFSKSIIKSLERSKKYNGSKITKAINFQYTPIEETLEWACNRGVDKK